MDDSDTWAIAAQSVGVSPSALSQGLAELERRVGVRLFDAVGRRRALRASARPVLDHARQVITLTRELVEWSARMEQGSAGRVRLGLIDVAAVVHFPEVLRRFRAEHPDVELTLTVAPSGALLDQLSAGRLDMIVCVEPDTARAGVDLAPLMREDLVVYAPPGTVIGDATTWGPWVLFPVGSHTRTIVEQRLRELGAPLVVAAESHQPDVLREMVRLGVGWTVLPRSQGADEGSSRQEPLSAGDRLLDRRLVMGRRHGAIADPVVDQLVERFRDVTTPGDAVER